MGITGTHILGFFPKKASKGSKLLLQRVFYLSLNNNSNLYFTGPVSDKIPE